MQRRTLTCWVAYPFFMVPLWSLPCLGGDLDVPASEKEERARFVGVWKGFAVEGTGERPDRGAVKLELTITEKTIHGIEIKGDRRIDHGEGEFTLDLTVDPHRLDGAQTNERGRGKVYLGIYSLEGDTLRWCVSPQKVRPPTFETMKGQFLLILKRDKSGGGRIIRNDVVMRDTSGNEIWCNGGHMIREGDAFYWIGYDTGPGRWPWRVNLYSSRDLAGWKFENTVMRMEGALADMGWAGRPALLHCKATGSYVIVFEADSPRQWKRHKVGFATCRRIDGTYELANAQYPEADRSTGDQSVYQEGEKAYLLATMDKDIGGRKYLNQSLAIFELSKDFLRIERKLFEGFENVNGDTKAVPRDQSSREASHIAKVGDIYYWLSSGLVGWNSSATMYATAKDLAGPWSDLKLLRTDPASNDSFNTQHDFVIPIAGSKTTTYVYVGDRYSQWTKRGPGRNIFLPLVWEDGEPVLRWLEAWRIDVGTGRFSAASESP